MSLVPTRVNMSNIYLSAEDTSKNCDTSRLYRHYNFLFRILKQSTEGIIFIKDNNGLTDNRENSVPLEPNHHYRRPPRHQNQHHDVFDYALPRHLRHLRSRLDYQPPEPQVA